MQSRSVIRLLIAATGGLSSVVAQDLSFEKSVAADALKHDNYDEAIVIYTKVIARNPRDASAYYDRGVIQLMKGDFSDAIADLTQALQLDPTKVAHYSALAIAHAEEGPNGKGRTIVTRPWPSAMRHCDTMRGFSLLTLPGVGHTFAKLK